MLSKVSHTIQEHQLLTPGDRVIVAVSGGADSMALLSVLHRLASTFSVDLAVAHVDHGLRGEESKGDALFVKEWATKRGLPVYVGCFDVQQVAREKGISTELAAREVRYNYLKQVAQSIGANKIAVAHHGDDQVETILMRFLRGTSLSGLTGIPLFRDMEGIRIIRPFIYIWRDEIEAYCKREGISYRTDSSNASIEYFRNKIRLHLLPHLQHEYNKNVRKSIFQLGEILKDEDAFIENEACKAMEQVVNKREPGRFILDNKGVGMLPVALQRRVIKLILYYLSEHTREWESIHIESIRKLVQSDSPSASVDLGNRILAFREYDQLHIVYQVDQPDAFNQEIPLIIPGHTNIPELGIQVDADVIEGSHARSDSKWEARFDFDLVSGHPFFIRSRKQGDIIRPFGMAGTKKVKNLLIDAKVPRRDRDRWPLLVWKDQIEWVVGVQRGRGAAVTEATRQTLRIRVTTSRG